GLSTSLDGPRAADEAATEARSALGGDPTVDLAVVFASTHHARRAEEVLEAVHDRASPRALIGCVAEAVIGRGREVEGAPAVSVWLASMPGDAETFDMVFARTPSG